jgi:hypothetical protein
MVKWHGKTCSTSFPDPGKKWVTGQKPFFSWDMEAQGKYIYIRHIPGIYFEIKTAGRTLTHKVDLPQD